MSAAVLMVQGTGSEVGKSMIAAGLCRAFSRRGFAVRPFKPQNMSNNAAVTADGGEIGRAQALQARACGMAPSVHMNPVLLKPQSDIGAQLVVQGRVSGNFDARAYTLHKAQLLDKVMESFSILGKDADFIIVEGAGSPAETNLRAGDIANMGFAEAANAPVVLVADIERGGVIANLVGTYQLLSERERARVAGFVINKFRGDVGLFDEGAAEIERRTGWPCLGVLPYFDQARHLPAEDAVRLQEAEDTAEDGVIKIAVPVFARIANYDDLDPLAAEPDVSLRFVKPGEALPGDTDLIVLPGSKSTRADLDLLFEEEWDVDIRAHLRRGGWVIGLCGGYQMLGKKVADPDGIEGPPGASEGLGLLAVETVIAGDKALSPMEAVSVEGGHSVYGYEMHMGRTEGDDTVRPMLKFASDARGDGGAMSADGKVMGCYLHGLFQSDSYRAALLTRIGQRGGESIVYDGLVESALDGLALHLERHLDMPALAEIAGLDTSDAIQTGKFNQKKEKTSWRMR